jgi:hypothetical protein
MNGCFILGLPGRHFMSANERVFLVLQQQLNLAFPNGRQPVALAHDHGHVKAPAFPEDDG